MAIDLNKYIGTLAVRLILGLIFFQQGFWKVFSFGVENLYKGKFFYETYKDLLPDFIIYSTAYYTSYMELIAGFFLIIGFKTNYALYALASVLVVVSFGHGLSKPIWDVADVFYRFVFLIIMIMLPQEWNKFSLDTLVKKYKNDEK